MPNAYRYAVSLRIRHPSMDPARITSTLHLKPYRCWRAGELRRTPIGTLLKGNYRETYWTSGDLAKGSSRRRTLAAALNELLDRLTVHRKFFRRVRRDGGRTEFFIGWYIPGNTGDEFNCDLLARMADLKIDLSPDIYPPDEAQRGQQISRRP